MPEAPITANIHQSLDVEGNLSAEMSFNLVLILDDLPEKGKVIIGEGVDPDIWVDIRLLTNLLS